MMMNRSSGPPFRIGTGTQPPSRPGLLPALVGVIVLVGVVLFLLASSIGS